MLYIKVNKYLMCIYFFHRCIIAMGLDKNPTSPKPRKEKSVEKREELKKGEGKLRKGRGHMIPRRSEMEGNKATSVIFSAQEEKTGIVEVRTAVEEMELKEKPGQGAWEDAQENIFKYGNGFCRVLFVVVIVVLLQSLKRPCGNVQQNPPLQCSGSSVTRRYP